MILSLLNTGTIGLCFHKDGKISLATIRLKIYVSKGMKMPENS
jgi:hypothetical protein